MAFQSEKYAADKFESGVWREIDGGRFRIAKAGNSVYEEALEANAYRKAKTPKAREKALYTAVAIGILKDWEEVIDAKGTTIPYSVVAAVKVLAENPDLVTKILEEANDLSNFRREDIKEQADAAVGFTPGSENG